LLLIAGDGLATDNRVVYRAVDDLERDLKTPSLVPSMSTATLGVAEVVSIAGVPHSLTIRLPKAMRPEQSYALWVVNARQEWSEAVRINDARPLWATPAFAYASARIGSEPRYLKVVGRNLEPDQGASTSVRLIGPMDVVLQANRTMQDVEVLDRYQAQVLLPDHLRPGRYRVLVRRDRSGWVELRGQTFEVRADPPIPRTFPVSDPIYGHCRAGDGLDASNCLVRAIAAAADAGGGTVVFGPGSWHLSEKSIPAPDGIVVPRGVNLSGAGPESTTVVQDADGPAAPISTTFTLMGGNTIQGITFRDDHRYSLDYVNSAMLRLGAVGAAGTARTHDSTASIDDVVITKNRFDRPNVAIGDSGMKIRRLFITDNEIAGFRNGILLDGNRFLVDERFGVEDAVIAHNLFVPGSYVEPKIRQGTVASELGASLRVDFSHNAADGNATTGLYSGTDARGWRAAFFWHMNNNVEMLLVSDNTATCTGDKAGDGEAISYDNNANTFGLARAGTVLRASPDSVTVQGPLIGRQNDRIVHRRDYYVGHWIQVGFGPGTGQVRKIVAYGENAAGEVTFEVAPSWDVLPAADRTRINIGREYWQVYTVANRVDHRRPLCEKSNLTSKKGGGISVWAQTADSVVEGNRQFDTDGITFQQYYNADAAGCATCTHETSYVDFLEIRGNLIDGEYDWNDDCSSSGIYGSLAAGPAPQSSPPTVGYGLSISHNIIDRADGEQGGGISLLPTWFKGPPPERWPLVENALIHHNELRGFDARPATPCQKDLVHPRTAIDFGESALVHRTVLYANVCPHSRRPLQAGRHDEVRVCPSGVAASCECEAP
jgi:hypothetical protein